MARLLLRASVLSVMWWMLLVVASLSANAQDHPAVSFSLEPRGVQSVQEGALLTVNADVSDDVQVRNVELLVDGVVVQTDGQFPFQFFLTAPLLSEVRARGQQDQFSISVRATDTGGNRATAEPLQLLVTPDTFGPTVVSSLPVEGEALFDGFVETRGLRVTFSESVAPATVNIHSVSLVAAGADNEFGTDDDAPQSITVSLSRRNTTLSIGFSQSPPIGEVRLRLNGSVISDLAGNILDGNGDGQPGGDFVLDFAILERPEVFWAVDEGGYWDVASNWSTSPKLPGPESEVGIAVAGVQTVTHRTGSTSIYSLSSTESISIMGGSLSTTADSEITASLSLSGGSFGGEGTLYVNGLFSWTSGAMEGSGKTASSGGLTVSGPTTKFLRRTLEVAGGGSWTEGNWFFNGGTLRNLAGSTLAFSSGHGLSAQAGTTNAVVNAGVLRKTTASDTQITAPFTNEAGGEVRVEEGTLTLGTGFVQASLATIRVTVLDPARVARVEAADVSLNGALVVAFAPGFTPSPGAMFDVVLYTTRSGLFSSVTAEGLSAGLVLEQPVQYLSDRIRIRVAAAP